MTCSTSLSGKNRIVLIAGILMIATTLRVTFTGAAPLLDTIRSAYSLTTAQTGLLTTLPLLAFALISPLAAPVARRFGMERSLFAALLLICAGIAIRSLPSPYLLFGGTAVIGGGIALGNVLLPGLIKRDFPHSVARLTGAYSLTMGAAAALGSAMVVPLALNGFGWQGALFMLTCFPLLALFLWLPQWRSQQHANLSTSRALHTRAGVRRLPGRSHCFFGINSLVYYVIIGWLPAILISHGYSEAQAGSLHGLLQLATAAPGLLIPLFLTSCERSAWYCSVRCLDVRSGRCWALLYASARDHLGLAFRFWFRRNNDTGVDVHWSSGKFCASGGGTLGDGTIRRVFAGSLWAAANG
ncbi:MFS transporter [Escherichia coli]